MKLTHQQAELLFVHKLIKKYKKTAQVYALQLTDDYEIETREGWLNAKEGDWLVINVSPGVSYPWPVKKEIFEATYEEVKE